jgi:hypothetical protein
MRDLLKALTVTTALCAGPAIAESGPVVIELYTSQGCSSCPPADDMLSELATRDDVIPLALHVDYWDYIGWKDSFANPEFTRRQQDYSHAAGASTIYTPQMVIGGVDHVIGSRPMEVADLVQAHLAIDHGVDLDLRRDGDVLAIAAETSVPVATVVQLVRIDPEETVAISRGENAGREITYTNIVTSWQIIGAWDGTAPLDLQAEVTGEEPVVVLIQRGTDGPILAAAQLR